MFVWKLIIKNIKIRALLSVIFVVCMFGCSTRQHQSIRFNQTLNTPAEKINAEEYISNVDLLTEIHFAFITKNNYISEKILKNGDSIISDESFRIYIKPSVDCYLYIFNIDSSRKVNLIFPVDDNISARNPLRKNMEYFIPERKNYIFNDVKGKELFYVFAFKEQPDDIEMLIKQIDSNIGESAFIRELENAYSVKGTSAKESSLRIRMSNINGLPEILTGKPYIMKIYEFLH